MMNRNSMFRIWFNRSNNLIRIQLMTLNVLCDCEEIVMYQCVIKNEY